MKKKIILGVCSSIIVLLVILFLIITNGTGVKMYYSNKLKNTIEIPRYSFFVDEMEGDDTWQLEFIMFGEEEHIIQQLQKLYNVNDDIINGYKFMQWSVNEEKIYKLVIVAYEKQ